MPVASPTTVAPLAVTDVRGSVILRTLNQGEGRRASTVEASLTVVVAFTFLELMSFIVDAGSDSDTE